MTRVQIKWAAAHDWFHSTNGRSVLVYDRVVDSRSRLIETMREFTDFSALRAWAGY